MLCNVLSSESERWYTFDHRRAFCGHKDGCERISVREAVIPRFRMKHTEDSHAEVLATFVMLCEGVAPVLRKFRRRAVTRCSNFQEILPGVALPEAAVVLLTVPVLFLCVPCDT